MKRYLTLFLAVAVVFGAAGCGKEDEAKTPGGGDTTGILQAQMPAQEEEIAVITTSEGVVKMRLFPEEAPKAVENFKTLAKTGYYEGVIFHRVIEGFMIQGGDPTGTGRGGESSWGEDFEDEISPNLHFYRGAVAMANRGPNTNGSQFFIVQNKEATAETLDTIRETRDGNADLGLTIGETFYKMGDLFSDAVLDYYGEQGGYPELEYVFGNPYTIFGQVYEGLDVVDTIATAEKDADDKPLTDITIEKIEFVNYESAEAAE